MQGLPASQNIAPQSSSGLPEAAGASCCQTAGQEGGFGQILSLHIVERFSAKVELTDLTAGLQADPSAAGADAAMQMGQPAVDVSRLADLLAQMAGGLQGRAQVQGELSQGGKGAETNTDDTALESVAVFGRQGNGAARFAADGKILPGVETGHGSAQPGQLKEVVPEFAQTLTVQGAEHSPRADALAMVQSRHEVMELRQASPQPLAVEPRVGTPQWDGALGQKVVWMVGQNQQSADLHLNPPHLGPLEVRLNMAADGQTSVQFVSQHPVVREALESAVPRLREMLADNGIALGNVQVGAESFPRQHQGEPGQGSGGQGSGGAEEIVTTLDRPFERNRLGMLDLFA